MKSKTSLFSPALFRKDLTRFAPLWGIFLGILLLAGPVSILNLRADYQGSQTIPHLEDFFSMQGVLAILLNAIYAPLCAGLLFRYLHQPRAAYMMHAFPLNRATQYVTNALAGLGFAVVPYLLQFVLNILAAAGLRETALLPQLLGIELLSFLFFYGLAVFFMLVTGNTAIAALCYAGANFVFAAIPLLVLLTLQALVFGFNIDLHRAALLWLAPGAKMLEALDGMGTNWLPYLLYAVIGCVLLVLAWLHYRVRDIEQAGEAVAHKWARVAFQLLFTLGCTLGLGFVLLLLFSQSMITPHRGGFLVLVLCFGIASLIGWFAAQMMLKRTVKVFRKKTWQGWAIFAGVFVLLLCAVKFDLFGIQRCVPAAEQTEKIMLTMPCGNYSYSGSMDVELDVTDPADMDTLRTIHQDALQAWKEGDEYYGATVDLTYTLTNGKTVRRHFYTTTDDVLLLAETLNKPEYAVAYYQNIIDNIGVDPEHYVGLLRVETDWESAFCRDENAVFEAMLLDAAEGNLPVSELCMDSDYQSYQLEYNNTYLWIPSTAVHTLALFEFPESSDVPLG